MIRLRSLVCLPALAFAAVSLSQDKPNIVLILSDDAGYGDFGFTGSSQIETPFIDSIATAGATFSRGYVSGPVCSPSRAGLLTGKTQNRFGYEFNAWVTVPQPGDIEELIGLDVNQKTIGDYMKSAGYATGYFGKWHLGKAEQFFPTNRGFDEFWGFRGGSRSYWDTDYKSNDKAIECNYGASTAVTYLTDDIGRESSEFISRHKEEPFFAFVSFNAPHSPMHAKPEDLERFSWIEGQQRRRYAAMMFAMDAQVGSILSTLDSEGLSDNTVVIFVNDNGGAFNANGSINAPLNGMKGTYYEGGVRVPYLMKWPGHLKPGTVFEKPVLTLDLVATSIRLAGGSLPVGEDALTGVDLMPFLSGARSGIPHESIFWRMGFFAAMLEDDWKMIRMPDRPVMLFNIKNDPSEQVNLAFVMPQRTETMMKKLFEWEQGMMHPVFRTTSKWLDAIRGRYDHDFPLVQPPGKAGVRR